MGITNSHILHLAANYKSKKHNKTVQRKKSVSRFHFASRMKFYHDLTSHILHNSNAYSGRHHEVRANFDRKLFTKHDLRHLASLLLSTVDLLLPEPWQTVAPLPSSQSIGRPSSTAATRCHYRKFYFVPLQLNSGTPEELQNKTFPCIWTSLTMADYYNRKTVFEHFPLSL